MATEIFKEVIRIMSKYVHPMLAQNYVEKHCQNQGIPDNEFSHENVGMFLLSIANGRDSIKDLSDQKFLMLLNDLIRMSNRYSKMEGAEESPKDEARAVEKIGAMP